MAINPQYSQEVILGNSFDDPEVDMLLLLLHTLCNKGSWTGTVEQLHLIKPSMEVINIERNLNQLIHSGDIIVNVLKDNVMKIYVTPSSQEEHTWKSALDKHIVNSCTTPVGFSHITHMEEHDRLILIVADCNQNKVIGARSLIADIPLNFGYGIERNRVMRQKIKSYNELTHMGFLDVRDLDSVIVSIRRDNSVGIQSSCSCVILEPSYYENVGVVAYFYESPGQKIPQCVLRAGVYGKDAYHRVMSLNNEVGIDTYIADTIKVEVTA